MGVLKQGILGGFSGKVANIIGTSWKGIAVIKAMPLSVANPKTAGQVAQRALFKNCSLFGVIILATILKPLWDRFSIKMSGFNSFVKENIDLFAAEMPSAAADLIISKGKMAKTDIAVLTVTAASAIVHIEWSPSGGTGYKLATDIVYVVIVNETQETVYGYDGTGDPLIRSDGENDFTISAAVDSADVINCYLAFKRVDGTIVSNTAFKTATVA